MADNATNAADDAVKTGATDTTAQEQTKNVLSDEEFTRRVQSETDKRTAEYGKRIANLQSELEEMKKAQLSEADRKKYEDEQRTKEIEEKDRLLTERENRLTAIDELTKAKMYDGSDKTNAFVDLVIKSGNKDDIVNSVKIIKAYIDEQVTIGVDATFKTHGRNPNGGSKSEPEKDNKSQFAVDLGKRAAQTAKKSNDILSYYTGGKK